MTVMNNFEKMNWHDNHIHKFYICERGDVWSGALALAKSYAGMTVRRSYSLLGSTSTILPYP